MSVIATFVVTAESFPLGSCIETQPSAEIEIERIVPMREKTFPFVFVWDHTDFDEFERTARSVPEIERIEQLETFTDGRLYKLTWEDSVSPLVTEIIDNEGTILEAKGDTTRWRFELRFPDHTDVSQFFQDVTGDSDIDLRLKSLVQEVTYQSSEDTSVLTPKQQNAIQTALELGYYDVPREAYLEDVAEALDISPSATSSLLRRGCQQFFGYHFME